MKRAYKIILEIFTGFLILYLVCFAWNDRGEFVSDLLWDTGFKTAEEPSLSEEELLAIQADFEASLYYPTASFYDIPPWGFIDGGPLDTACAYHPCERARIYPGFTQVTCWPSIGGFWTTRLGPVDLNFLGLSRLKDTPRSTNQTAEDEFCNQLHKFGPIWYEDEVWYQYFAMKLDTENFCDFRDGGCPPRTPDKPPTFYGYPSYGGVWVLELADEQELRKKGVGQLRNVFTMSEKCRVIEAIGGRFHSDVDNYWASQEK